jgi:transcriptional accessory protein Tex/SPT6
MSDSWGTDLRARFPDWLTPEALARWPENKTRLRIGQTIQGVVVARAPFGVWLDVDVGHPARLLVPDMAGAQIKPIRFFDYPQLGETVEVTVIFLDDRRAEIDVSQRELPKPDQISN